MITRRNLLKATAGLPVIAAGSCVVLPSSTGAQQTPPGKILFGRNGNIWIWRNGESSPLFEEGNASDPKWSPVGDELIFVRTGDSYSDLILRNLTTGVETALTANQAYGDLGTEDYVNNCSWALDPYWSASGLIAFVSDYYTADGTMSLFLMNGTGSAPYTALMAQDEGNIESATLAAGSALAGYTVRSSDVNNYNMTYVALRDLDNGVAYPILSELGSGFDPAFSPDDANIVFSVRSGNQTDLWLVSRSDTSAHVRITEGEQATSPCWSPDGSWLAYVRMVNFKFEIWARPHAAGEFGEPQKLAEFEDLDAPGGLSWSLAP
jgi:Tol biopolymer transport system component